MSSSYIYFSVSLFVEFLYFALYSKENFEEIHTNKAFRGNRFHLKLSRTDTVDLLRALSHQGPAFLV